MGPGDLEIWSNHFEYHALRPSEVPAGMSDSLTADELRLIASSVSTVQLGDQATGPELLYAAERFAQAQQAPNFARITELLIHEELRHASLLSAFMRTHWIPLKRTGWTYRWFGLLRRHFGLQGHLSVLISAELIVIVYYRALESVTQCQRLRILCRIIVSDKLAHVGFESDMLAALRAGRAASRLAVLRWAHRGFFVSAALVAWLIHRRMLRHAGHSTRSFLRACLAQYHFYLESPCAPAVLEPRRHVLPYRSIRLFGKSLIHRNN